MGKDRLRIRVNSIGKVWTDNPIIIFMVGEHRDDWANARKALTEQIERRDGQTVRKPDTLWRCQRLVERLTCSTIPFDNVADSLHLAVQEDGLQVIYTSRESFSSLCGTLLPRIMAWGNVQVILIDVAGFKARDLEHDASVIKRIYMSASSERAQAIRDYFNSTSLDNDDEFGDLS